MKYVSVFDFRDNLAYYLDLVAKNQATVVVEKYNKPTVVIRPYKKDVASTDFNKFFGFLSGHETGEEYVNRIRRSKAELLRVRRLRNRHG